MARITVEDCIDRVENSNAFLLVLVAAFRARKISMGLPSQLKTLSNDKPSVQALREIAQGSVDVHGIQEEMLLSFQNHSLRRMPLLDPSKMQNKPLNPDDFFGDIKELEGPHSTSKEKNMSAMETDSFGIFEDHDQFGTMEQDGLLQIMQSEIKKARDADAQKDDSLGDDDLDEE